MRLSYSFPVSLIYIMCAHRLLTLQDWVNKFLAPAMADILDYRRVSSLDWTQYHGLPGTGPFEASRSNTSWTG